MFKGRISRVFDLEPEERGSSANARGSSGQLCLPTLDERVTLYLRAVYGKSDFTREEYSEARKLILNAMAADFAAKSGAPQGGGGSHELGRGPNPDEPLITTPLRTLREGPQNYANGLPLISFPDPSIRTPWAVHGAALARIEAVPAKAPARTLTTRRISISIFAAAAAASVALLSFAVLPIVWRPADQNSSGSRLALVAPSVAAADAEVSFVTRDLNTALPRARIAAVAPLDDVLAGVRDAANQVASPAVVVASIAGVAPPVASAGNGDPYPAWGPPAWPPVAAPAARSALWLKNRRETVAAVAPVAPTVAAMAAAPVAPAAPPVAGVAPAAPVIPVARAPLGAVAVSVRPNDITQAPPLLIWNVVRRGLHLLAQGQITDARQLLLRWEAQGETRDAAVALALGTSYDPIELEQLLPATASPNVVPDSFADIAMARTWYQKAKDLGSIEAERRLESLADRESQSR